MSMTEVPSEIWSREILPRSSSSSLFALRHVNRFFYGLLHSHAHDINPLYDIVSSGYYELFLWDQESRWPSLVTAAIARGALATGNLPLVEYIDKKWPSFYAGHRSYSLRRAVIESEFEIFKYLATHSQAQLHYEMKEDLSRRGRMNCVHFLIEDRREFPPSPESAIMSKNREYVKFLSKYVKFEEFKVSMLDALVRTVDLEFVEWFLATFPGFKPNLSNIVGYDHILYAAIKFKSVRIFELIISWDGVLSQSAQLSMLSNSISEGCLECVLWFIHNYNLDIGRFHNSSCWSDCARVGAIDVIAYGVQHGLPLTSFLYEKAVVKRHVDLVQWLEERNCPIDYLNAITAAVSANWEEKVYELFAAMPIKTLDAECYRGALMKANIKMLKWLHENKCPQQPIPDTSMITLAIKYGGLAVLRFVHETLGVPLGSSTSVFETFDPIEVRQVLKYYIDKRINVNTKEFWEAYRNRFDEMNGICLQLILSGKFVFTVDHAFFAVRTDNIRMLRWILKNAPVSLKKLKSQLKPYKDLSTVSWLKMTHPDVFRDL